MNRTARTFPAVVVISALAVGGVAAAAAAQGVKKVDSGMTKVRSGVPSGIPVFSVTSSDLKAGRPIPMAEWTNTFGCAGGNQAPRLHWTGATSGTGDASPVGYTGPCPPAGDTAHHYEWTVLARDVPSLPLPAATTPAVVSLGRND